MFSYRPQKRPATHFPRCHYNKQRGRRIKAKRPFETREEAVEYMTCRHLEIKYTVYKCRVCGKYHIGHKTKKD